MIFFSDYFKKCPFCRKLQLDFKSFGVDVPVLKKYSVVGSGKRKALCVKCNSTDRERLIYLYLRDYLKIFDKKEKLKVLHIAPEPNISKRMKKNKNIEYIAGDNFSEGYHYNKDVLQIDVQDIPFPDNNFDMIICNHVLEHIEDDGKAMKELFRVLKPGGEAVLQVPISYLLEKTLEDFSITDPEKRLETFGQKDHVRIYGKDYKARLEMAGFMVNEVRLGIGEQYVNCGLNPNELIYSCGKK